MHTNTTTISPLTTTLASKMPWWAALGTITSSISNVIGVLQPSIQIWHIIKNRSSKDISIAATLVAVCASILVGYGDITTFFTAITGSESWVI